MNAFGAYHGLIQDALNIFNSIDDDEKDTIMITTMMKILIANKRYDLALIIYDFYNKLHDNISHILAIKACIKSDNYDRGDEIYNKLNCNLNDNDKSKQQKLN